MLFFDLVAMGLVGSLPETRAEIAQNLWDEIGQGSQEFTHVNLYKDLLKRRDIALPENHFAHLYDWQGSPGITRSCWAALTVSITTNRSA